MATVFVKLTFLLIVFELTTAFVGLNYKKSAEEQKAWNAYIANIMQGHGAKTAADANKPYDCVDNHDDCEYWAGIGECDKNPDYMLINCKKSCEVCPGQSIKDCVDNHEDCEYWAGIEECDKNPGYMLINCKKSCEICRGESIKDCVDNHEDCEYWAGIGECDNNPDYMLIKCKKSCEVCPE